MARAFAAASTQYLEIDATPVTAAPFSFGCWFRTANMTDLQTLMWIGDKDASNMNYRLQAAGSISGDPLRYVAQASSASVLDTAVGYSANTWHHALAVEAALTDHRVFLDGANKVTNTTSRNPSGEDRIAIGRAADSTPTDYMDGRIAEAAIWNVALTDAEAAILASGVSPRFVQPSALVAYWPLWGLHSPEVDLKGAYPLALLNAPTAGNHAPVVPFTRRWSFGAEVEGGAGGGIIQQAMHHYRHNLGV